jgi:hypothetical protein
LVDLIEGRFKERYENIGALASIAPLELDGWDRLV